VRSGRMTTPIAWPSEWQGESLMDSMDRCALVGQACRQRAAIQVERLNEHQGARSPGTLRCAGCGGEISDPQGGITVLDDAPIYGRAPRRATST